MIFDVESLAYINFRACRMAVSIDIITVGWYRKRQIEKPRDIHEESVQITSIVVSNNTEGVLVS